MLQHKKFISVALIVLPILIMVELIMIIIFPILITKADSELANSETVDELYDYCEVKESDDEVCEAYFKEQDDIWYTHSIDEEVYGDVFSKTYYLIRTGSPIPDDYYHSFVTLSEEYADAHYLYPISATSHPTSFITSTSHDYETSNDDYPLGLVRRISIDYDNSECAVFDFHPSFSFLYSYILLKEGCENGAI